MATYNVYRSSGLVNEIEASAFSINDGHLYFVNEESVAVWVLASGSWYDIELADDDS